MKTIFAIFLLIPAFFFSSCNTVNEGIPDVNTYLSNSFKILIRSNTGESESQFVDVSSSSNYNDFKHSNVEFEISKITYRIKNYNAPEGMILNGTLICSNDVETETYTIGSINQANLSVLEAENTENTIIQSTENRDKLLSWLDSPGKFKAKSGYTFTNPDGTPFTIGNNERGSNFVLVVTFHLTVKPKP